MSLANAFSNPLVLAAGVAIGAVVLFSRSGGDSGNGGYALAALQVTDNTNRAMLQASASATAIQADITRSRIAADVSIGTAALASFTSIINQNTVRAAQNDQIRAGVMNNVIATNTAIIMDRQQNTARIKAAHVARDISQIQTMGAERIAQINANAAMYVAKKTSNASMWSNIVGSVASVAKAAIPFL